MSVLQQQWDLPFHLHGINWLLVNKKVEQAGTEPRFPHESELQTCDRRRCEQW